MEMQAGNPLWSHDVTKETLADLGISKMQSSRSPVPVVLPEPGIGGAMPRQQGKNELPVSSTGSYSRNTIAKYRKIHDAVIANTLTIKSDKIKVPQQRLSAPEK